MKSIKATDPRCDWIDLSDQSWRFKRWFAWRPVKTFDAGWIWFRWYWRKQQLWGWGFWDDWPYLNIDCPMCRAKWPRYKKKYHSLPEPAGMIVCINARN